MTSAQSFDGEADEILVFDTETETNKIGDVERLKLISLMKEKMCFWANGKFSKPEKDAAIGELEEAFGYKFTSSELLGVWKSLRSSMLREVRKGARHQVLARHRYKNVVVRSLTILRSCIL